MIRLTPAERTAALATLGLSANASPEEVTAAYRRLARVLHPDATGRVDVDAAAEFVTVSDAYHLLAASSTAAPRPAESVAPSVRPRARVRSNTQDSPIVAGPVLVTPLPKRSRRTWSPR